MLIMCIFDLPYTSNKRIYNAWTVNHAYLMKGSVMPRLTIDFPDEVSAILEKLAKDEKTSKREVVRRALAMYNYFHEEGVKMGGEKNVAITDKSDKVLTRIVFAK